MNIGYARVSTKEQNLDLQIDQLTAAGCEKIFSEKVSGRTGNQEELKKCLDTLRSGDVLMVYSVCRLGRTTNQLFELIDRFKRDNIKFKSLTEGYFDTSTPMGEALLQIISVLKAMEVNISRERSQHGLEAARERGVKGGRPKGLTQKSNDKIGNIIKLYQSGASISSIVKTSEISRSQIYRFLKLNNIPLRGND